MNPKGSRKPLYWMGSSLEDLREFPEEVQRAMGFALHHAQMGGKHVDARPLKGFKGAGVLEVVEDFDGDTYRAVYTVRFTDVVYVLHSFQKKSKTGVKTPRKEIDLVTNRLRGAEDHYAEHHKRQGE